MRLCAPLLLAREQCFSHPVFLVQKNAIYCMLLWAVLLLLQSCSGHSTDKERDVVPANGSAEDVDGEDFSPFSANHPELEFNFVQWTYGSQDSVCLIAVCSLAARLLQP